MNPNCIQNIKNEYSTENLLEHDGIIFPLNPNWKKIGISVSGGADSALLAYLLSYYIWKDDLNIEIHFISNIRMWETRPWQRYDSLKVYNRIKTLFPSLTYYRHENFIPPELETGSIGKIIPHSTGEKKGGDAICTFSFAKYICVKENLNAWFAALTKNPPKDLDNAPTDRNNQTKNDRRIIESYKDIWILHPFCDISKDWVLKQYKDLDIIDLFEITRSCEGDKNSAPEIFNNLDFYSYKPFDPVPTCGKCFWCLERDWALKQNNL